MDQIRTVDRFVLFVVRRSQHDLSLRELVRLTGLPEMTVMNSIEQLKSSGAIEIVEEGGAVYYLPVGLSQSALMGGFEAWLEYFCSRPALCEEGDSEAMTFECCGVVILSAVLAGSRDPQLLTPLTTLPEGFVRLVLGIMERSDLWWSDRIFELERTIRQHASDFPNVDSALHGVTEEFWNAWRSPRLGAALETFRAGQQ